MNEYIKKYLIDLPDPLRNVRCCPGSIQYLSIQHHLMFRGLSLSDRCRLSHRLYKLRLIPHLIPPSGIPESISRIDCLIVQALIA